MKARLGSGITREESGGVHTSPARHINGRLNVNAIGCRMQNKQMKVMRDCGLGSRIGKPAAPGSEP